MSILIQNIRLLIKYIPHGKQQNVFLRKVKTLVLYAKLPGDELEKKLLQVQKDILQRWYLYFRQVNDQGIQFNPFEKDLFKHSRLLKESVEEKVELSNEQMELERVRQIANNFHMEHPNLVSLHVRKEILLKYEHQQKLEIEKKKKL